MSVKTPRPRVNQIVQQQPDPPPVPTIGDQETVEALRNVTRRRLTQFRRQDTVISGNQPLGVPIGQRRTLIA